MSGYRHAQGFTLIELLMTTVLIAIISVVVGRVLFQLLETIRTAEMVNAADWQGMLALERIANDLHTVRSPSEITNMASSQLTYQNINQQTVQYQLSGTNLLRNGQLLASGIAGLTFTYLNVNGSATPIPNTVRYISITLASTNNTLSLPFSTLVELRSGV